MLSDEQKALRRTGIGGSDIAAIVGQDPYRGPLDVYLAKVEGWEVEETEDMERGSFLEDGVARWYAHRTGATLRETGTVRHPSIEIALCTPDRIAALDGVERDLSIKVPGPRARENWGEPFTDEFPLGYLLQLQWEHAILTARGEPITPELHLAAPIDGKLGIFYARADQDLQGMLMHEALKFWRDHIEPKRPPPIDGSPTCREWMKRRFPRDNRPMLKADAHQEVMALELLEAKRAQEAAEERAELVTNRLKEVIGDAAGLEGVFGRLTWKADKNGKRSFRTKWKDN